MRIVPIALSNYFIKGIPIRETILNHNNIYDFCLRLKTNSTSTPIFRHFDENKNIVDDILPRTTRYYISNFGGILLKDFGNKISGINVGYYATLFNKYEFKKNYDINYNFYIIEANKIKDAIIDKQLYLF